MGNFDLIDALAWSSDGDDFSWRVLELKSWREFFITLIDTIKGIGECHVTVLSDYPRYLNDIIKSICNLNKVDYCVKLFCPDCKLPVINRINNKIILISIRLDYNLANFIERFKPDIVICMAETQCESIKTLTELNYKDLFVEYMTLLDSEFFGPEILQQCIKNSIQMGSIVSYRNLDKIMREYEIDYEMFIDSYYSKTILKIIRFEYGNKWYKDSIVCKISTRV